MNGGTLKWAFSVIVWTLCGICVGAFLLFSCGKISPEIFEKIIDKFGAIGFMTMVAQAFLHADRNHDGIPDSQQLIKGEIHVEKTTTIDSKPVVNDTNKSGAAIDPAKGNGENPTIQ